MTIVFLLDVYYCIIVSWTLFYLFNCFVSLPSLPWEGCGKYQHFFVFNTYQVWLFKEETANEIEFYFKNYSTIDVLAPPPATHCPIHFSIGQSNTGSLLL